MPDKFEAPREQQFVSTGYLCGSLKILPKQLQVLMADCHITFSMEIDDVGFLSVPDGELIARRYGEVYAEIADAVTDPENVRGN